MRYFDPSRMIRTEVGGEEEERKDDSTRNDRSAIERDLPALWFNFWRQLKSDADRGKSVINEPATFGSPPLPAFFYDFATIVFATRL